MAPALTGRRPPALRRCAHPVTARPIVRASSAGAGGTARPWPGGVPSIVRPSSAGAEHRAAFVRGSAKHRAAVVCGSAKHRAAVVGGCTEHRAAIVAGRASTVRRRRRAVPARSGHRRRVSQHRAAIVRGSAKDVCRRRPGDANIVPPSSADGKGARQAGQRTAPSLTAAPQLGHFIESARPSLLGRLPSRLILHDSGEFATRWGAVKGCESYPAASAHFSGVGAAGTDCRYAHSACISTSVIRCAYGMSTFIGGFSGVPSGRTPSRIDFANCS